MMTAPRYLPVLMMALWLFLLYPSIAAAGAWPGDAIGDGFGVQVKPERTNSVDLRRIKAAGFNYVRYDMDWGLVERQIGVYDWLTYDRFIGALRTQHLKSLIILDGSNPRYEPQVKMQPQDNYGYDHAYAAPSDNRTVRGFAAFAAAAAKRYGTDDVIWEIWNEPDMGGSWPPRPDAKAFSALTMATCQALRQVAPKAIILGPAIARLPDPGDSSNMGFLTTFLQLSSASCLDAFSIHPYRASEQPPEFAIPDYTIKVRRFLAENMPKDKKPLPLVDSEWGYSSSEVTATQQAAYALRIRLADVLSGIPLTILYEWQDSAGMLEEREKHFGIIDASKTSKPAGKLVERLLPLIKDAVVVRRIEVQPQDCFAVLIKQPTGRYQLLFWVGRTALGNTPAFIRVGSGASSARVLPLSLTPQLAELSSPSPDVTVVGAPPPPPKSLEAPRQP